MTSQFPITPPPELVQQWYDEAKRDPCGPTNWVAVKAAQWGAEERMHAICAWLDCPSQKAAHLIHPLLQYFCPKSPSLTEDALALLERMDRAPIANDELNLLHRVVQRLQELESNG